ncbi:hypothetical protein [Edaphobacter modestus]|uniref:Uncharacterized protein n=1 Tax=Edaphobacter modestus TaxID=388466 RepID=A0A4Q7XZ34_9BACT|nr:hypothetical protein [Edaphobacter modestus]RZU29051.1 hypothetical protein BDD14_6645 [Edaphobacter modestus]
MRLLIFLVAGLVCSVAAAQSTHPSLADRIDVSRTIIAKLDRAAQNDPPPNFASEILVQAHKDATTFIGLADMLSTSIREGKSAGASSMVNLYFRFTDLYDQYDLFANATSGPRQIDLQKVRSVDMAKEFYETKTVLQFAALGEVIRTEGELQACHSRQSR